MEKETFQLSEQLAKETRRNLRIVAIATPFFIPLIIGLLNFFLPPYVEPIPTTFIFILLLIAVVLSLGLSTLMTKTLQKEMAQQTKNAPPQFFVTLTEQGIERHNKIGTEFFPYTDIRQLVVYRHQNGAISHLNLKAKHIWLRFGGFRDLERLATLLEERVPQQATRQSKRVYVDSQHPLTIIGLLLGLLLVVALFMAFVGFIQEPLAISTLGWVLPTIMGLYMVIQRPLSSMMGIAFRWAENLLGILALLAIPAFLWLGSVLTTYDRTHLCHPWNRYVGQSSCVATFKTHKSVAFLPDQHTLVLADSRVIWFQPVPNRIFYRSPILRPQGRFREFAMTPDGQLLASLSSDDATYDDLLELWDLSTHTLLDEEARRFDRIYSMHLHPNQPIIALSNVGGLEVEEWLYSTTDWQPVSPITHTVLSFSPDGTVLLTRGNAAERMTVQLWQIADWTPIQTLRLANDNQPSINQAVFSPDGQWLAADGSFAIHIWHLASNKNLFNWRTNGGQMLLVFSPTQPILAVTQEISEHEHEIEFWSLTDGEPLATIPLGDERPSSLSFSSDGALLAVGTYSKAMVFQMDKVLP